MWTSIPVLWHCHRLIWLISAQFISDYLSFSVWWDFGGVLLPLATGLQTISSGRLLLHTVNFIIWWYLLTSISEVTTLWPCPQVLDRSSDWASCAKHLCCPEGLLQKGAENSQHPKLAPEGQPRELAFHFCKRAFPSFYNVWGVLLAIMSCLLLHMRIIDCFPMYNSCTKLFFH